MRHKLATLLLEEPDWAAAEACRESPVEPARPSPDTAAKAAGTRTSEGLPVQSLEALLEHLKALTLKMVSGGKPA